MYAGDSRQMARHGGQANCCAERALKAFVHRLLYGFFTRRAEE
jgi:hypothetical protein